MPVWQFVTDGTGDSPCGVEHFIKPPGNSWQVVVCARTAVHASPSRAPKPMRIITLPHTSLQKRISSELPLALQECRSQWLQRADKRPSVGCGWSTGWQCRSTCAASLVSCAGNDLVNKLAIWNPINVHLSSQILTPFGERCTFMGCEPSQIHTPFAFSIPNSYTFDPRSLRLSHAQFHVNGGNSMSYAIL